MIAPLCARYLRHRGWRCTAPTLPEIGSWWSTEREQRCVERATGRRVEFVRYRRDNAAVIVMEGLGSVSLDRWDKWRRTARRVR